MEIKQISVIGIGLIGGSIVRALTKYNQFSIVCIDRDGENTELAAIDNNCVKFTSNMCEGVTGSDLIFICTPVMAIPGIIEKILPYIKKGTIITDVGSTKKWLMDSIKDKIPQEVYFIGGHPMAGSENMGYCSSRADLFKDAVYILVPYEKTPQNVIDNLKGIINLLGARSIIMDNIFHDSKVAVASHLPYILSVCLSCTVDSIDENNVAAKISAGGMRDMTRISASSIDMWRDICITNKKEIKNALYNFKEQLDFFIDILDNENISVIESYLSKAKKFKHKLIKIKGVT